VINTPKAASGAPVDVCAEMRALCSSCGGTGDVHGVDGEWRGECTCPAGLALTLERLKIAGKKTQEENERLRAALSRAQPVAAAPADWQLVPKKADHRMAWAIMLAHRLDGDALRIAEDAWRDALSAAPAAPVAPGKCPECKGAGVVDDGEIDCHQNGEPYMNGPVKCVKDCPVCTAPVAQATTASKSNITSMVDAAMVEMANINPPLRRSECARLIRAAMRVICHHQFHYFGDQDVRRCVYCNQLEKKS